MFTSDILKVVSKLEFLNIYKNNIIIDRVCKGLIKRWNICGYVIVISIC